MGRFGGLFCSGGNSRVLCGARVAFWGELRKGDALHCIALHCIALRLLGIALFGIALLGIVLSF